MQNNLITSRIRLKTRLHSISSLRFFFFAIALSTLTNGIILLSLIFHTDFVLANTEINDEMPVVNHPGDMTEAGLLFKYGDHYSQAPQLDISVEMNVSGLINRAKVSQQFTNPTEQWQEGIYVFPLPEDAAVDHMRLRIGDRIIEGQIKEKQAAKKIYTEAKRQGKQAALTEQERPNIFTTSVANIAPQETVFVEIEYQQTVHYDNGEFSLRFPMVVAPRYIPGNEKIVGFAGTGWANNTNEVPDAARITPPVISQNSTRSNRVSLHIALNAGLKLEKIESTYHPIKKQMLDDQYLIDLSHQENIANKDFELIWKPISSDIPRAAFFTEQKGNDTYAMIMMLPPSIKIQNNLSREIIYVIDTSGSMAGQSILQAKAALELAVSRLKAGDYFNIIQFNSSTSSLFSVPQAVNTSTRTHALQYIRSLNAGGGTEMAMAMQAALNDHNERNNLRQVIFMTDGSVGNEQALFEIIEQQLGRSRLFTVGIGSAPNSHFMQRAASFGRGTHTYIGKLEEVQTRMESLFTKIESPVLKDISIDWGTQNLPEMWPDKLRDLYQGEPLLFTTKSNSLPSTISIKGLLTNQTWTSELDLKGGQFSKGISTLWARNKISALMQKKRDAEFESIKQLIIDTALQHHLVSNYTSLIAVDVTPVRPLSEKLSSNNIPTHLPEGWERNKVFSQSFPQTATNARVDFLMGLFLILLSLIVLHFTRSRSLRYA